MGLNSSIILISSGQPSANPRLVKEAIVLSEVGYKVTVIYAPISPWADVFDKQLFAKYPNIQFIKAGYHFLNQRRGALWARIRRKLLSKVHLFAGDILNVADYSTILFGQELLKTAKLHKADLYIAHNLGALPIAVKVAQKYNAKVGFDAEDFHRGEFRKINQEQLTTEVLENKYIPKINYLTAASPLIGENYKKIFSTTNPVVINNVFPISYLPVLPGKENNSLKLFWFSQTIGKKRGLENIIKAMGMISPTPVSLTLLGNVSPEIKEYLLLVAAASNVMKEQITFYPTVAENRIFKIASSCDIGLGAELPYCLNREYCLTNKIFTYLIAGNALVLSNTIAQERFLEENPNIGLLYKFDEPQSLARVLKNYVNNPELLALHKANARNLSLTKMNWERESEKFLDTVRSILS